MQALSVDAGLLRSLREQPWHGRVHSVFDRVVNAQDADGALITLASRDLDNAPDTLRVDVAGFGVAGLATGDRVAACPAGLEIGGVRIRLQGAVPWHTALPAWPSDLTRLRENLAAVRARKVVSFGANDAARTAWPLESSMTAELRRRSALLCAALRRGDLETACRRARDVIGLGQGLTPSGDDYLVGLFAVLHLPGRPARHSQDFCAAVVAGIERRTNAISAAALEAAARGQVRECIQALLRGLTAGTQEDVGAALRPVLAIGSTSGADIVAGIVAGFEVILPAGDDRSARA